MPRTDSVAPWRELVIDFGYRAASADLFASGVKAKNAERVHDNTPVSNRLNLTNAAVRTFAERPVLGLGWTGFRTHSRDDFRHTADHEMATSGVAA